MVAYSECDVRSMLDAVEHRSVIEDTHGFIAIFFDGYLVSFLN